MALKEIFELSSILQGDDHEKDDLEKKKKNLTNLIRQQEMKVSINSLI